MTFLNRLQAPKNILINYATKEFRRSQCLNANSAKVIGGISFTIMFQPRDIALSFRHEHKHILDLPRGGGLWLWKPFIIFSTLRKLADGDVIFYADSGSIFVASASPLLDLARDSKSVICFDVGLPEEEWSKRDAYVYMDADVEHIVKTNQRLATFQVWYRSNNTLELAEAYLKYCSDQRIISDDPSVCGLPEYPKFRENRHDQTVFSILTKKNNIPCFRDPSTEPAPNTQPQYGKVLHSTRQRHFPLDQPLKSKITTTLFDIARRSILRAKFRGAR